MATSGSQPKVLIVDDEEELREILSEDFETEGFEVETAASGSAALELLEEKQYDLIVSDIRMPNGDGVELLDKLRTKHHERPPFLFTTGFADISVESAMNKGCDGFLRKPIDYDETMKIVHDLLLPKEERWKREVENCVGELRLAVSSFREGIENKVFGVGRSGIFLKTADTQFKIGQAIRFYVSFEDGTPAIEGAGVIRWVRTEDDPEHPPGVGVEFFNLAPDSTKALERWVEKQNPKAFIPID